MATSKKSSGGVPRGAAASSAARGSSSARAKAKARQKPAREPIYDEVRTARPLDRSDLLVAGGAAIGAGALFLTTFSSHVALGDAPETVAGVRSLGILHAPGYVSYVLAARVFGEIVRFGSWEFRVNLFSVVCASLTVALTYLLARAFTANRSGAVVGAFALAATASFWFNAGFAKHYAFTSLLVVSSAFLVVWWQERNRPWLLIVAGALIGFSLGAGWQLAFVMAFGLLVLLVFGPRRPELRTVVAAGGALVVAMIAVCVFILVRAGQDPTMNFGSASTLSRLFELLATSDFSGARAAAGAAQASRAGSGVVAYVLVAARDIGLGAIVIGAVGVFDVCERRRWDHVAFFGLVVIGNIAAVGAVAGLDRAIGFFTGLVSGGLLIDALAVVAVLAALGTTRLTHALATWRSSEGSADGDPTAARWTVAGAAVIGLIVVVPSLVVHYRYANHEMPPLADRYAARVLAGLPKDSVLLSGGFEFAQPVRFRQVVDHDRPDVDVVSADMIGQSWYREQLVKEFGLDPALLKPNTNNYVARFVSAIRQKRPVFADAYAMYNGRQLLAFQPNGFVGEIVDGTPGTQAATGDDLKQTLADRAAALDSADVDDGLAGNKYLRFPNLALYYFHERAHVELAKQFALSGDFEQAAAQIDKARSALPDDISAQLAPDLRAKDEEANKFLLGM